jgi:hypothetical protein
MNQRVSVLLLCILLVGMLLPVPRTAAQEVPPVEETVVTFAALDVPEQQLRGPFDSTYVDFSLPASWDVRDGAALQLYFNTFFAGSGGADAAQVGTDGTVPAESGGRTFGGTLEVHLNDILQETVLLDQMGERSVTIPLALEALQEPLNDERHILKIVLDTDEQCGLEQFTSLVIRANSHLVLPHQVVPPPTDLARLPYPIYQHSFRPDAATLVVPDAPTASELQAALTIAAGLGRLTDDEFALDLRPLDALTDVQREQTHLIFVGKPTAFPLLAEMELPAPVSTAGFNIPGATDDDGVIQMVVSPWNATKVLLIATGASDAAVVKAAQAVSSGTLRTGEQPDLAVVAAIQSEVSSNFQGVDQTLGDLGYGTHDMYGLSGQYAVYRFDLPAGQQIEGDAYLDLVFVHSGQLDYEQSGMMIVLNDEPIASVRLDDNSTRLGTTRLTLPATALRPGSNQITIRADLLPRALCIDPRSSGLWMSIRPESLLHLPLAPAQAETTTRVADLSHYPRPITTQANLRDLALVLSPADPISWEVATTLIFDLGAQMQGPLVDLAVVYGDDLPEQIRAERHLLLVGRPSQLPLIAELDSALPAPFEGGDLATEPEALIVYRTGEDVSMGYLQLLAAPWNAERTILAVLGSSDTGVEWAGAALTTPELRSKLAGNLAVVQDEQIESSDTRSTDADVAAEAAAADTEAEAEGHSGEHSLDRQSLMLLLALAGGALVVLGGLVFIAVWWRQRRIKRQLATE